MLRVLSLSTLYPTAERPSFGTFVERQTLALARLAEVQMVSGVGIPPWPLSLHPHYAPARKLPAEEDRAGIRVYRPRFRVLPGIGEAGAGRALARAALPLLRRLDFDVIDSEYFWPDGVAALHLSRALGRPFSVKARGSDIHFWGGRPDVARQMVEAAEAAPGLLAVSAALKRDMAALGMPSDKIQVHHTGVDLERFRPVDRAEAKAALGVSGPLIVSPGNLIAIKGHRLAVEALEHIPGATLLIAGEGPERGAVEALIAAGKLGHRARLLGSVPPDEMPGLLAAADLMILPSEREGLANVWVEALACGTPILVPDVGGASEVVDRPEAGRLVGRDSQAIAAAAREMLAAPPAPEEVRKSAERFSWERNGEALFAHLSGIA